jgi:hypothetical protein
MKKKALMLDSYFPYTDSDALIVVNLTCFLFDPRTGKVRFKRRKIQSSGETVFFLPQGVFHRSFLIHACTCFFFIFQLWHDLCQLISKNPDKVIFQTLQNCSFIKKMDSCIDITVLVQNI